MAKTKGSRDKTELAYDSELARGLRRARLAAGIGFRESGRLAGLDITSIWRIENGEISPTLETLERLLRLYGANLNLGQDGLMLTWLETPKEDGEDTRKAARATRAKKGAR
jgi:transcriptional regulator with XRE-family HTH domain